MSKYNPLNFVYINDITLTEFEHICISRGYTKINSYTNTFFKFNGLFYINVCFYNSHNMTADIFDLEIFKNYIDNNLYIDNPKDLHNDYLKSFHVLTLNRLNEELDKFDEKYKDLTIKIKKQYIEQMFKTNKPGY